MKNVISRSMSSRSSLARGLMLLRNFALISALVSPTLACGDDGNGDKWQVVQQALPGALLSVWGTSASDVWAVGGDARDGTGPLVIHYDGTSWERIATGETEGNLWWIFGFEGGPVFMGGDGGLILSYQDGVTTRMETPGTGTVWGIWGASPDDVWAVGGVSDTSGGFAWHLVNGVWTEEATLPADVPTTAAVWKVHGRSASDVWFVGSNGVSLFWDGSALSAHDTGVGTSLFTVHSNAERYVAVGGTASGIIMEYDGSSWINMTPDPVPPGLTGVVLGPDDSGYAVGQFGSVYQRVDGAWQDAAIDIFLNEGLHGAWIDPEGGLWAVGGQTFSLPLTDGVIIHYGAKIDSAGL